MWGQKNRSLDQLVELPCEHPRGRIFSPTNFKLAQNDVLDKISDKFDIGSCGVKNRSQDQTIEKPCEHPRGHIFSLTNFKLAHNDVLDKISVKFENGSCGTKK